MAIIEQLTPEQEAYLPVFRQEILDIAFGGGRADRDKLQAAMNDAYACIGKAPPRLVICESPKQAMLLMAVLKHTNIPLDDSEGIEITEQMKGQIKGQSIWNSSFLWGSQDLYWIAWGKFAEHIGVQLEQETSRSLDIMWRISCQCEWWWPYDGICFASERPTSTSWDDRTQLHNETGYAVQYADGYGFCSWHGVRVPEKWIFETDNVDPAEILQVVNVEQRAAGAAIIGWPRMLSALDSKTIDEHENPRIGSLIELTLPGLDTPGRFLKAECPRNGTIVEGVPYVSDIDGLPIETAIAAQAWRIGDPQSEYVISPRRT